MLRAMSESASPALAREQVRPPRPRRAKGLAARPGITLATAIVLVLLIGVADEFTGYHVRLAVLYLVPVALATWARGRSGGIAIALLSLLMWVQSFESTHGYAHNAYFYWDGVVLMITLLAFAELFTRLRDALARSDERFVRVLDGLDAAVFVADDRDVLYVNARMAALFGGTAPQLATVAARFPLAPDSAGDAAFTGSEMRDAVDGRWYLAQRGSLTWIDGRRVRLAVLTDVTEQKRAESLQREHQAALQHTARLADLAEAATTLAHELNQPLVAIVGYNAACLRLLDAGDASVADLAAAMEKCRVQAVRAGEIVARIRELMSRRATTLSECDINAMLREVLGWARDDLDRARIGVDLALAERLPIVRADRILVQQVMQNLVNNAADAMQDVPQAQRRLAVRTAVDDAGTVQVSVADRGTGVAPDAAPRLFTPFFTTKARGLGLGLSICRSVIEMHGGRIWHEARADGGTTFHFSLPKESA